MTTSENQKTVTTRGAKHDKENIYCVLNQDAMFEAMALLKPNAFKLWCYMAKNQNGYTFALSRVDACKVCNMSKPTYLSAVQELIEVGYMVNTSGNHYNFFEELPKDEELEITVIK